MNTDILAGKWKQLRGKVQEEWGELTNDDMDRIDGNYDQLVGTVQEKYGHSRDEAKKKVDRFLEHNSRTTV